MNSKNKIVDRGDAGRKKFACSRRNRRMLKMRKMGKRVLLLSMVILLCIQSMVLCAAAKRENNTLLSNRYNVVFVIDESGSMLQTDPEYLRYEATDLFLGLMSKEGNYVGTISFDNKVIYSQNIMQVNSNEDKSTVSDAIKTYSAAHGDTDIGNAMQQAVKMLQENANPDLPSTIVLLTDGNTDLDNNPDVVSKEEEESLQKKSEAISQARAANIPIYSVCLNENGKADFSETRQISDATGGEAKEVTKADDLKKVFEMFYELIYRTKDNLIYEGKVPVKTEYTVPSIGVEEANIMIEGKATSIQFIDPSGNEYRDAVSTEAGNITLEKILTPDPGVWTVSVDGDPNATVRVSLLYNYNFRVKDTTELSDEAYSKGDKIEFEAVLTDEKDKELTVTDDSEYTGEVRFVNEKNEIIDTLPMKVENGTFRTSYKVTEQDQAYRYYITVAQVTEKGEEQVYKETEIRQFISGNNTAPKSNGDVEATVKLWPFKKNVYELDLTKLASDKEDSKLQYSIVSTSFIDKKDDSKGDFEIKGDTLKQTGFSLRKGEYIIRCTDSGGLSCDVKVTVNSINIGVIAAIGILLGGLIVLIAVLLTLRAALKTPFYGDIYVKTSYEGEEIQRTKSRGRIKLNAFNIPITGVDGKKSYFQAMRGEAVKLVTNKEVSVNGRKGKEHVIYPSGNGTPVQLTEDGREIIYVRFVSRITGGVRRRKANNNKKRMSAPKNKARETITGTRGTHRSEKRR